MSGQHRYFVRRPANSGYLYYGRVDTVSTWVERREHALALTRHQASRVIRRFPEVYCEVVAAKR